MSDEEKLFVQDKEVVVPGEVLAEGLSFLPGSGTYRLNDKIIANRLGLLTMEGKVMKTVPMAGRYLPKRNDVVIGKVIDILMSGWRLEINSPYSAVLPLKDASFSYIEKGDDLTRFFELDDYMVCKITNVTSQNLVDVSCKGPGLQKLKGGRIIEVNTHKVPRIIGKRGSMVSMIKNATGCKVTVGQNGIVWISGEPEMEVLVVNTLKYIEERSHIQGLTEMVKEYLEKATGKTVEVPDADSLPEDAPEEGREFQEDADRPPRRDFHGGGPRSGGFRSGPRGGGFRSGPRGGPRGRPPRRDSRRFGE
ncbi:RNA-binding protein [Candidatus Woesearchaeota archaeon]|nr:RNA-binding protein [Candidatus Woesearchaeota archaeon]